MAQYRYVGRMEVLFAIGPPVRVLSPGEVIEAETNPNPALFRAVALDGTQPEEDFDDADPAIYSE